jgi:hypothetical protein
MYLMKLQPTHHHEAQCQADGYAEYHTITEHTAGHHLPHIYIHHDGQKVHVHVLHHHGEREHHTHDFGDAAIFAHVDQYYGDDQKHETSAEP